MHTVAARANAVFALAFSCVCCVMGGCFLTTVLDDTLPIVDINVNRVQL